MKLVPTLRLTFLKFFLSCCFLLSSGIAVAQQQLLSTTTISVDKTYHTFITPLDDGGWILAVSLHAPEDLINKPSSTLVQRFDPCGEIIWSKRYTSPGNLMILVDFRLGSDGMLYLMGSLFDEEDNRDIFLIKLQEDGSIVFHHTYGREGAAADHPYHMDETADGQIMIYFNQYGINNEYRNTLLLLDFDGNIVFRKSYLNFGIWGKGLACSDGGFLFHTARIIYKVNSAGELLWSNRYSTLVYSTPFIEVSGGYVAATYNLQTDLAYLYKIDDDGNLLWTSVSIQGNSTPSIGQLENGDIVCLNQAIIENGMDSKTYLALHQFSPEGELLNQKTIKSISVTGPANIYHPIQLEPLPNEGILFSAFIDDNDQKVMIGKINTDLNLGCEEEFDFDSSEPTPPVTFLPYTSNHKEIDIYKLARDLQVEAFPIETERICFTPNWEFPNLPTDTTLCTGETLLLELTLDQATYLWQDGSTASSFTVDQAGTYNVVMTRCGVSEAKSIEVKIGDCPCDIKTPNAFTPDSDGVNDFFTVISDCPISDFEMRIFNRWGQLVFESNNPDQGWDGWYKGQLAPMDVYLFQYSYRFDRSGQMLEEPTSGHLNLIR